MAGEDVRQHLAGLESVEAQLRDLHQAFTGTDAFDRGLGYDTGHPRLSRAVDDFGGAWNDRRAELADKIARVADLAQAIRETFRELDAQYAGALEGAR
ncbi:hypothetical protein [Microbacterium album]|uniref:Flagellar protein FlgN n=1 Tax=Microbacterium album TaxID=2053191 RepID=A0A917MM79_9MICO|nr:hypothetical protein [Microbacterium album]GGH42917.1 hypothetical protein GCM10010921_16450 [Microbacterium album]